MAIPSIARFECHLHQCLDAQSLLCGVPLCALRELGCQSHLLGREEEPRTGKYRGRE